MFNIFRPHRDLECVKGKGKENATTIDCLKFYSHFYQTWDIKALKSSWNHFFFLEKAYTIMGGLWGRGGGRIRTPNKIETWNPIKLKISVAERQLQHFYFLPETKMLVFVFSSSSCLFLIFFKIQINDHILLKLASLLPKLY